jgi:ABC-2 type transport system permease protein
MMSTTRIRGIFLKELREYRRNRQIVISMTIFPLFFAVYPAIEIFALPASAAGSLAHKQTLVYMLGIAAVTPSIVAAYSIAGERQQGTLEPVLTTPITAGEFLLGKALAACVPVLAVSYGVFAVFVAAIELVAQPAVAAAVMQGPELLAQVLFTPLIAVMSIWAGTAISARSSDPRTAAQLSILVALPTIFVSIAIAIGGIHATLRFALFFGILLLIVDALGWRIVSPLFNRERLITGTKA